MPRPIRDMVVGMLEGQGLSQEEWEQSQGSDYQVDPLTT